LRGAMVLLGIELPRPCQELLIRQRFEAGCKRTDDPLRDCLVLPREGADQLHHRAARADAVADDQHLIRAEGRRLSAGGDGVVTVVRNSRLKS